MSNEETEKAHRLRRFGVSEDEAQALETIWGTRAFVLIADERSGSLSGWGYNAMDSLDAIWHEMDEADAHLYMQHGFTPHQAFLLATNPQARRNVWGTNTDLDRVHELLDASMPKALLAKTLLIAESPADAEALIGLMTLDANHPETFDPEPTTNKVEAAAALLPDQIDTCDCPPSVLVHPSELGFTDY